MMMIKKKLKESEESFEPKMVKWKNGKSKQKNNQIYLGFERERVSSEMNIITSTQEYARMEEGES